MNVLESLGREVSSCEDALLSRSQDMDAGKAAFLRGIVAMTEAREQRRGFGRPALAAAAAAAAIAVVGFVLFTTVRTPWPPGRVVVSETAQTFHFSDGSKVVFLPQTRGQVTTVDADRVDVALAKGRADISVVPTRTKEWRVVAGPFDVAVKGTSFAVEWAPEDARFGLEMRTGEVVVRGPLIPEGQRIAAPHRLEVDVRRERLELFRGDVTRAAPVDENPAEIGSPADAGEGATRHADDKGGARVRAAASDVRSRIRTARAPGWHELASAGDFAGAGERLEAVGLEAAMRAAGPDRLLLLGDTLRLLGRIGPAEMAYRRLRARYRGHRSASLAALQLGRLAFDHWRRYDRAVHWLETYLGEQRDKVLAREALGRLIEAAEKSDQPAKAARAARRYLSDYPDGPHAGSAAALIKE